MKNPFKTSMVFRVSVPFVIAAVLVVLGVGALLLWDIRNGVKQEREERLTLLSEVASASLTTPLSQDDHESMRRIVESLFLERRVVYVSLWQHEALLLEQSSPDELLIQSWPEMQQARQWLTRETPIEYEGQPIGSLRIAFSTQQRYTQFVRYIIALIGLCILLAAVNASVSWFVMKRQLLVPLSKLAKLSRFICEEKLGIPLTGMGSQEALDVLGSVLKHMTFYLQNILVTAKNISQGDLAQNITPHSDKDILAYTFQHMIAYLTAMGEAADQISQGDLQGILVPQSYRDQIGVAFCQMQAGLVVLISQIRSESETLSAISPQLLQISSQHADTFEHIGYVAEKTSTAMHQMSASAKEISKNMEQLSAAVQQTNSSITNMIASVKHVAGNSRELSAFADNTIETMLTIVRSLERITDEAERSKTLSEATTQDAQSGHDSVDQVIQNITSISEITTRLSVIILRLQSRSQEIGTILDVINEVAEQTSLLSLNASIIAAQAGEHGRGFAVVANEIKELAIRVGISTQEISKIVGAVQRDSSEAGDVIKQGQEKVKHGVVIANQAGDALQKIRESVGNSTQVATDIATVVREQTTTHAGIATSLQDVAKMIAEITQTTQEQEQNSSELLRVADNMQNLGFEVLRATHEQYLATGSVNESMEVVISLVSENAEMVKQLKSSANQLTIKADSLKEQVEQFVLPPE